MAKLRELKELAPKWMTLSLMDILVELDPTDTNKFVPMMMKILEKEHIRKLNDNWSDYDKEIFIQEASSIVPQSLNTKDFINFYGYYRLMSDTFNFSNSIFNDIHDFINLYTKKYLPNVDVLQIKSWQELNTIQSIASIKFLTKEFEKQIVNVFEDDKWLIVRPLTYEASLKYGSSTRWCTAAKSSPEHFFRYAESGMLFYFLNKTNGYKVALYKSVRDRELSFWDSADNRRDSMETELDLYIFQLIKKEITDPNQKANSDINPSIYNESFERNIALGKTEKIHTRMEVLLNNIDIDMHVAEINNILLDEDMEVPESYGRYVDDEPMMTG